MPNQNIEENLKQVVQSIQFMLLTLIELELPTISKHLSSSLFFRRILFAQTLVFRVVFVLPLCSLVSFGHCIVSILRIMASDYPFGNFNFFLIKHLKDQLLSNPIMSKSNAPTIFLG